jgi:hypothetical protein
LGLYSLDSISFSLHLFSDGVDVGHVGFLELLIFEEKEGRDIEEK